jgi:hypothetical protein
MFATRNAKGQIVSRKMDPAMVAERKRYLDCSLEELQAQIEIARIFAGISLNGLDEYDPAEIYHQLVSSPIISVDDL